LKRTTRHLAVISTAALRLQPDERLVTLVREGHDRAFEEIVRRFRSPLVGFARGFVGPDRAEDVVQGALLRAYDALLAGDSRIVLRPWLYRIVRNGAISELRATRAEDHLDESIDGVLQPPDVVEDRERFRSIVERVKDLPAAQREALVRTELAGAGHEDIAASLGTTPGGVRQLVFRARTALRDAAGMLLPLPAIRHLLNASEGLATGAAGAIGVATGAVAAGGGGGVKLGATVVLTALVLGSGAGLDPSERDEPGPARATQAGAGFGGLDLPAGGGAEASGVEHRALAATTPHGAAGESPSSTSDAAAKGREGDAGGDDGASPVPGGQADLPEHGGVPPHGGGPSPGPGAIASGSDQKCGGDHGGAPLPAEYSDEGYPSGPSDGGAYESPESAPPEEGGASVPEAQEAEPYDASGTSTEAPLPG
jgi:RNA polymerase sigma factor (sigma-70 family)